MTTFPRKVHQEVNHNRAHRNTKEIAHSYYSTPRRKVREVDALDS
jgi:hypothetical protein